MITYLQLIHTEQFSVFLTERGQSIFLLFSECVPSLLFGDVHKIIWQTKNNKKRAY